ncbi:MAG: hypothetical protein ACM3UZ_02605 [Acidobacteriota bacterium]
MRILDVDNDRSVKDVILYLTIEEAKELLGDLQGLVAKMDLSAHAHVNDDAFEHEVTVVVYDETQLKALNERSRRLIIEDI